jgi:hypothetical protein
MDGLCVSFEFLIFSQNIVYIADFKLECFPVINFMFNIFLLSYQENIASVDT